MCIKKIFWTRLKWDIESFEYILNRWTHQNTWNYSSFVLMMMCSVLLVEQYARLTRTLTHLRSMMFLLRKFIWDFFAVNERPTEKIYLFSTTRTQKEKKRQHVKFPCSVANDFIERCECVTECVMGKLRSKCSAFVSLAVLNGRKMFGPRTNKTND